MKIKELKRKVLEVMCNFMGKFKTQLLHSAPKANRLGSVLH